jgi:hypothetical protein
MNTAISSLARSSGGASVSGRLAVSKLSVIGGFPLYDVDLRPSTAVSNAAILASNWSADSIEDSA